MPAVTETRWGLVRELLNALDWVHEDRVRSNAPTAEADIRLKRGDLDERDVTVMVLRMQAAGFVERVGAVWRLTDDGRAMRDSIHQYAGSTS